MIVRCEPASEFSYLHWVCYDEKGNKVDEIECEYEYDPPWDREDDPDCCWHCYNSKGYEVEPPWHYSKRHKDEDEYYEDYEFE